MKEKIENLLAEGLNLDLFYSISFDSGRTSCQGNFTEDTQKHIQELGFESYNYLYKNDEIMSEYFKDDIRILLCK
jgi:hypothetical protein